MKKKRFELAPRLPTRGRKCLRRNNGTPAVIMEPRGRTARLTSAGSLLILALGFAGRAWGDQSIALAWDASQTDDVTGYVLYYGSLSRVYVNSLDVGENTTATVQGLKEGTTYFFAVTAYNPGGLSSSPSEEISYQVPIADPGPPVQISMGSQAGAAARLRFPASPGKSYELQTTTDFQSWTTLWSPKPVTRTQWLHFEDKDTADIGFYRLLVR